MIFEATDDDFDEWPVTPKSDSLALSDPLYLKHVEIARKISQEARDPQYPFHGKYVGLANGKVVAVGDDLDSVDKQLRLVEPNHLNCFIWHVDWDENEVVEIWETS